MRQRFDRPGPLLGNLARRPRMERARADELKKLVAEAHARAFEVMKQNGLLGHRGGPALEGDTPFLTVEAAVATVDTLTQEDLRLLNDAEAIQDLGVNIAPSGEDARDMEPRLMAAHQRLLALVNRQALGAPSSVGPRAVITRWSVGFGEVSSDLTLSEEALLAQKEVTPEAAVRAWRGRWPGVQGLGMTLPHGIGLANERLASFTGPVGPKRTIGVLLDGEIESADEFWVPARALLNGGSQEATWAQEIKNRTPRYVIHPWITR